MDSRFAGREATIGLTGLHRLALATTLFSLPVALVVAVLLT